MRTFEGRLSWSLNLYLIETPFDTFANGANPDLVALTGVVRSGSTLFAYGSVDRCGPTQVNLTSNLFVLFTNGKVYYTIIHSEWSLA